LVPPLLEHRTRESLTGRNATTQKRQVATTTALLQIAQDARVGGRHTVEDRGAKSFQHIQYLFGVGFAWIKDHAGTRKKNGIKRVVTPIREVEFGHRKNFIVGPEVYDLLAVRRHKMKEIMVKVYYAFWSASGSGTI